MIDKNSLMNGLFGKQTQTIELLSLDQIDDLYTIDHPFDKSLMSGDGINELAEQIKSSGVLEPIIVRFENGRGRYECLAGHRRRKAAGLAGLKEIPSIIMDCDDDTAKLIVTDTNLGQRERILPSEKAFAYKMQLEALQSQRKRMDLVNEVNGSLENVCGHSRDIVAERNNISPRMVSNYIRLTKLNYELLDMVDDERITLTAGFVLARLTETKQNELLDFLFENPKVKINEKTAKEVLENGISILGEEKEPSSAMAKNAAANKVRKIAGDAIARYQENHAAFSKISEYDDEIIFDLFYRALDDLLEDNTNRI